MYSKVFYSSILVSLLLTSLNVFAGFLIVVNDKTDLDSISVKELRSVYLKKVTSLPTGESAVVSGLKEGDVRDEFLLKVLRKTDSTLNSYWSRLIFTGRANPPRLFSSSEQLLEFIAKTPGAIAYINDDAIMIDGVKKLELIDE